MFTGLPVNDNCSEPCALQCRSGGRGQADLMASGLNAPTHPVLAHEMATQQLAAAQRAATDSSQLLNMLRHMSARLDRLEAHE